MSLKIVFISIINRRDNIFSLCFDSFFDLLRTSIFRLSVGLNPAHRNIIEHNNIQYLVFMLVYNLCIVITQGITVATCIQSLLCILTFSAAAWRGVQPALLALFTSADARQRCSTIARWPCI